MITAEDTYDVADKVLEIPLDQIREAPDNVRTDLGDLDGLAASIAEVGVLQPITIIPDGTGDTFTVMLGARRRAAAQQAGLMTIPAIVRTKPDSIRRVMAMLIENVQRHDLAPLDEAGTFQRLGKEFDLTQDDIARRVGCSQPHVAKRLALLDLPAKARKMLAAGELTIGTAYELSRLAAEPKRIDKVLKEPEEYRANEIEDQIRELEHAKQVRALHDKLKAADTRIVGDARYPYKYPRISKDQWDGGLRVDRRKHAKEPCHAVVIDDRSSYRKPEAKAVCTDPARHTGKGDSTLKTPKGAPTTSGKSTQQIAKEKRERELANARRAFMTDILNNAELDTDQITDLALNRYLDDAAHDELAKMCKLFGFEKPAKVKNGGPNYRGLIAGYIDEQPGNKLRACLAFAFVQGEWGYANAEEHAALLTGFGYTPPAAAPAAQAAPKKPAAKGTKPVKKATPKNAAAQHSKDEDAAILTAMQARESAFVRARELGVDEDDDLAERIVALEEELAVGVGVHRALEIANEFDAMFVQLNELEPGDVVDHDGEGHTIERADAEDDDVEAYVKDTPDVAMIDQNDIEATPESYHEWWSTHADTPTVDEILQWVGIYPERALIAWDYEKSRAKPRASLRDRVGLVAHIADELDAEEVEAHAAPAPDGKPPADRTSTEARTTEGAAASTNNDAPDADGPPCPHPGCVRGNEHDGAHALGAYAKKPKDQGTKEIWCRIAIADADPTNPEVIALQQELYAGVDEGRAAEIAEALQGIIGNQPMSAYVKTEPESAYEGKARAMIAELPAEHEEVAELQQELYRGISIARATRVIKDLRRIKAEIAKGR